MKYVHLILVNPDENRNCIFNMTELGDCFETEFKRVSARGIKKKYPMKFWDKIYGDKLKEGYIDKTELVAPVRESSDKYKLIPDEEVRAMFDFLLKAARKAVSESYSISYDRITPEMVKEARFLLDKLGKECDEISTEEANEILKKIFIAVPRKMKDVGAMLAGPDSSIKEIYSREDELLSIVQAQVKTNLKCEAPTQDKTILDKLSLEIRQCSDKENEKIKEKMGPVAHRFVRAFRVKNLVTEEKFNTYCRVRGIDDRNIHYYYHGSRNMNYYGLLTEGPKLNPNAPVTGKMFGYGLYYANKARKSINYTSVRDAIYNNESSGKAYLAVYKVAYKNPMHVQHHKSEMCSYTAAAIKPYDALFAHGGADLVNDEIIIYEQEAVTIQYLIEIR